MAPEIKRGVPMAISNYFSSSSKKPRNTKLGKFVAKRDAQTFFEERGGSEYKEPDLSDRNILNETKVRMKNRGTLAKLELLLLDYTFNEDDGRISFSEKRAIKKLLKRYDNLITKEDIQYLININNTTLGTIINYISQYSVDKHQVNKALHTLHKICKNKEQYNQIIDKLEFRLSDDYDRF